MEPPTVEVWRRGPWSRPSSMQGRGRGRSPRAPWGRRARRWREEEVGRMWSPEKLRIPPETLARCTSPSSPCSPQRCSWGCRRCWRSGGRLPGRAWCARRRGWLWGRSWTRPAASGCSRRGRARHRSVLRRLRRQIFWLACRRLPRRGRGRGRSGWPSRRWEGVPLAGIPCQLPRRCRRSSAPFPAVGLWCLPQSLLLLLSDDKKKEWQI